MSSSFWARRLETRNLTIGFAEEGFGTSFVRPSRVLKLKDNI